MILLKNATVVTQNQNRDILKNTDILISDKIEFIGQAVPSQFQIDETIDCAGKLVMPGLINTHTHAAMALFRGYGDNLPLKEWLETKIWPAEKKLKPEHIYAGTKLAILEMIKSGTIAFNDMYFFGESVKKAVEEMGIRSTFCEVILEFPTCSYKTTEEAFKIFETQKKEETELFKVAIGPHSLYSCSKKTLLRVKELAEKTNSIIHIHMSETRKEAEDAFGKFGKTNTEYLEELGLLNSRLIAAHCTWLLPAEMDLFERNNVNVSHCPASNLKLSSGIMPQMVFNKTNVTLGTDGPASNNCLDLMEDMKIAGIVNKLTRPSMQTQQILDAATINGAQALNLNSGSIEIGKKADLIILDLKKPHLVPVHDIVSNIVYSAKGADVNTTIINGRILMRDRKTVFDESRIMEEAEKAAYELVR